MVPRPLRLAACALLFVIAIPKAHGQATPTASKTIELSVFAGVTGLDPKYGPTTKEIGYVVGGDITRHFHILDIAFEGRYTNATGFSADESTYGGGLKFSRQFQRFHPYVDLLIASGTIKFDHPEIYGNSAYTHDNSTVYSFGFGVDYDVTRQFAVKLDAQGQRWVIGVEQPAFEPYNASIGIVYRIPFSALRRLRN